MGRREPLTVCKAGSYKHRRYFRKIPFTLREEAHDALPEGRGPPDYDHSRGWALETH